MLERNKRNFVGVNLLLFAYFLVLNFFQPLVSDDLCRGATAALWNHTILENLGRDYMTWTGRMTAQWLAYVFFNAPLERYLLPIFNFLNAFFVVLLIDTMFKIITINNAHLSKSISAYCLYISLTLVVMYATRFFANSLWKTGGLQYVWGLSSIIYITYMYLTKYKSNNFKNIFMFVGGLFIGNYNEILFSSIIIIAIAYCVYIKFLKSEEENHFLPKSFYLFLLGDVIGGGLLLAAPGNYVRLGVSVHGATSLLEKLLSLGKSLLHKQYILYMFLSFIVLSAVRIADCEKSKNEVIKFMLVGMTTLAVLFMQFLPIGQYDFDDRMFMFWIVVALLLIFSSVIRISWVEKFLICHSKAVLYFSIILLAVFMSSTTYAYHSIFEYNKSIRALVEKSKKDGIEDVVVPKYAKANTIFNHVISGGVSEDKEFCVNKCTAAYYGVGTIVLKK